MMLLKGLELEINRFIEGKEKLTLSGITVIISLTSTIGERDGNSRLQTDYGRGAID